MPHRSTSLTILAYGALVLWLHGALSSSMAQTSPHPESDPMMSVRVIALGQTPPPKYRLETIKDKDSDGYFDEQEKQHSRRGRARQKPVMLPENPAHYPPRPLYLPITRKGDKYRSLFLTPGNPNIRYTIPQCSEFQTFRKVRNKTRSGKNQIKYQPAFSAKVPHHCDDLLVLLRKPSKGLAWENYTVHPIDLSTDKVPAGHLFIINMSDREIHARNARKKKLFAVAPSKQHLSKKFTAGKKIPLRLFNPKGLAISNKTLSIRPEMRTLIIIYDLLKPKAGGQTQGVMIIQEKVIQPTLTETSAY